VKDLHKINDQFSEIIMQALNQMDNFRSTPPSHLSSTQLSIIDQQAEIRYNIDPLFYARVQTTVSMLMAAVRGDYVSIKSKDKKCFLGREPCEECPIIKECPNHKP
jgi:hypothetical protein